MTENRIPLAELEAEEAKIRARLAEITTAKNSIEVVRRKERGELIVEVAQHLIKLVPACKPSCRDCLYCKLLEACGDKWWPSDLDIEIRLMELPDLKQYR